MEKVKFPIYVIDTISPFTWCAQGEWKILLARSA